jgi:hypothetical protein
MDDDEEYVDTKDYQDGLVLAVRVIYGETIAPWVTAALQAKSIRLLLSA